MSCFIFMFVFVVCLHLYVCCASDVACGCLRMFKVAFLILRACGLHVVCFCVVGSFVCACMLVFRVIVSAFAFVCCQIAFHITRVRRLPVYFAFVFLVSLFCACACLAYGCVCV